MSEPDADLRYDRLRAMGALAGGLAHELNNVLAAVLMTVDLLSAGSPSPAQQGVAALEETVRRGLRVTRQLHWFARGVEGEATAFQPQYLIADLQKLAAATFRRPLSVITAFPPDLAPLHGDPVQVYQLLLHLAWEAREAVPGAAELRLGAHNEERAAKACVVLEIAASAAAEADEAAPDAPDDAERVPPAAWDAGRAAVVAAILAACGGFAEPLPSGAGTRAWLPAYFSSPISKA